jgi:predicted Zn-dependent protease
LTFDLQPEEARLLLNVALMATGQNRYKSADAILSALERFRPADPSLYSAKAVLYISRGDFAEAVDFVDNVALRRFPGNPMLLVFKGMALLRGKRNADAAIYLREAAAQTADFAAAALARDLLADI